MAARERSEFRGGRRQPNRVGLGVGWSGVGWWLVAAKSATLSKRENKIGVSKTSSILGGLGLGGDDLDGGANELPTATTCAISPVLGCDETGAIWGWGWCWVRRDQCF